MGNENGSVNPQGKSSSNTETAGLQSVIDPTLLNSLEWRLIGPFRGGRVVAVAGDPVHSQVYYFGSTGGGVWKTTDGGILWENVSDGFFKRASVGAIAVSASDPNVIYVGMGETTIRGNVSHGDGVYRSTDAGKSWTHLGLANTRNIAKVRIHPQNPDLVYVAALGHAHGPKAHDGTITTERPDQMWGMDATSCLTRREGTATVFVVVDHCAAECIGLHVAKPGTRFEAVEPLRQGLHALFGGYEAGIARGLLARHDHGSQYVSDYFQDELKFLGITSSPAFVREPEGNGVAERFIRTLKEQLLWVRTFDTVEELRLALLEFKERYNRQWLCERHGHHTPAQVRAQLLERAA